MGPGFGGLIEWGAAPVRLPNVRLVEGPCGCAGCKGKNVPLCVKCGSHELYEFGGKCAECREAEEC